MPRASLADIPRYWNALPRFIHWDMGHDPKRSVILAGTGRSGSTWVGDLINHDNHYRVIFEPLASRRVPSVRHFKWGQRLAPDCSDPALTQPLHNILAGRINGKWTDQYNRRFISRSRLIKFIRANLMLAWIRAQYPSVPIILLLRHPCAVAHSMLSLKDWQWNREGYTDQPMLFNEILSPFRDHITRDLPLFERYITNWCIEYFVPFSELRQNQFLPVFYEDLCLKPEVHLPSLLTYARGRFDPAVLSALAKPSQVTRKGSSIHTGEDIVFGWKHHVTPDQQSIAREIMHRFGLADIYDSSDLPSHTAIQHLLVKHNQ